MEDNILYNRLDVNDVSLGKTRCATVARESESKTRLDGNCKVESPQHGTERPKSSAGRRLRRRANVEDESQVIECAWDDNRTVRQRPSSSYGRSRRKPPQQASYDCNYNDISVAADKEKVRADPDANHDVGKKKPRPQSSYGRRRPNILESPNEKTSDAALKDSRDSDKTMPPRPSTSYGRMCRASIDNDDDADSSGGSRGRPQSHTSPRGDKASTYAEKETAKSLFRPNSSRARHRSSSGSPDNIDCQVFADVNDAGDNSDQRNTRAEIGRNCRQNVEISVARRRHVSSDSFSFRSATSEDYALREKKIAELYRLKHPSKKTYRLKPLKMKDRPLRSASEGDAETIFDEIITFNRDPRSGDAVQNLTIGKSSPLGKLGRKTTDGVSNQPLVNSVGELVEPAGSDNNIFTRNSVDSVSLCVRRDEYNNRSDVAGYHANETLLGLRDLPVERPAKLCQLSKESKAALISNGDNNSSANNNHGSRSALLSTDAEADERISLTDAQKDSCKNFSQGLHSHDLDLENSARKEDFSLLSSPAPPREQPPPQRLSKLHTRRLFRDRGNDGILPSYPVITANGKTLRTSSSKDSDSSEPSTPTSPHDFVMESKLERSGSQKNRGTPFASNPPPQRPDSAASSRPGSALADRPRTGQGSRSGSGREGQRPARSIAQLKKLSSQEMDDLKDGRRSQLLRAQSLPEGGMEPEKNKQSLSEMMEDIKECRYIRRQDSKE